MRITIGEKLTLGYLITILLMVALTLYAVNMGQSLLRESVGKSSILLTEEMLKRVNYNFRYMVEHTKLHTHGFLLRATLSQSNSAFQNLEDIHAYIEQKDAEWAAAPDGTITPFMQELMSNALSTQLREEYIEFWKNQRGYPLFVEVIITNTYGVNVAQTHRTSDYYQANEEWWQAAKENEYFTGEVEYDEVAQAFVIPIAVRINDQERDMIGIIKAVVSMTALIREAEVATKTYETTETLLISAKEGKLIYATRAFQFFEDVSDNMFFKHLQGERGFFIAEEGNRKKLYSYTHAPNNGKYKGLDWILVMEHDEREVLKPVAILRKNILITSVLLTVTGLLIAFFISRSITLPIGELIKGTEIIGNGDLTHRVALTTRDEIGELAAAFNQMTATRQQSEEDLRKSETRFRELFDNINSGVAVYEARNNAEDFVFTDFNCAGEQIENTRRADLLGKSVLAVFPGVKDFGIFEVFQRVWRTGQPEHHPISFYKDDRIVGWRENYVYKLPSGEIVAVYDDVTERKQTEEELRKYREHLEELVEERTAELKEANQKLQHEIAERKKTEEVRERLNVELDQKNKELEQIVYVTSHDLRSPLVNVQGFSKELKYSLEELGSLLQREEVSDEIREAAAFLVEGEITEDLSYILTSIAKMDTLLSGLLKLSRLGRAALTIEILDMNALIAQVAAACEFQIQEAGATLDIARLPPCRGDAMQINQVFSNLLENALKYLDPGRSGHITIWGNREQTYVVYCVEDNGIGIAPEHQGKIFEVFHRLDPLHSNGEGLGLTTVRKIIERLNGRVWLKSETGQGSQFFVSLPGVMESWCDGVME